MKRTKHLVFAIALTLFAGLCWNAQAQVISTSSGTKLQAIEISAGVEDPEKGLVSGAAYLGKTGGDFPGSFFMTMDYEKRASSSLPPLPEANNIKNGTWSLPMYSSNGYLGAIYGRVVEGTISWDKGDSMARLNLTLSVDGGTQQFAGMIGKGYFAGTLDRATKGRPVLSGELMFELQPGDVR